MIVIKRQEHRSYSFIMITWMWILTPLPETYPLLQSLGYSIQVGLSHPDALMPLAPMNILPEEELTFSVTFNIVAPPPGTAVAFDFRTDDGFDGQGLSVPVKKSDVHITCGWNLVQAIGNGVLPNGLDACNPTSPAHTVDFSFDCDFHIDHIPSAPYCFKDIDVRANSGAQIIVDPGKTLNIEGSTLFGCSGMWKGITVQNGGSLVIDNSVIKDAEFAIHALPGSSVRVTNTEFVNNYVGIYIPDGGVDITTIGNTFKSGPVPLPPAYTGQPTSPSEIGYAGIWADNQSFILVDGSNDQACFFDNVANGIVSNNSNVAVGSNTRFINNPGCTGLQRSIIPIGKWDSINRRQQKALSSMAPEKKKCPISKM